MRLKRRRGLFVANRTQLTQEPRGEIPGAFLLAECDQIFDSTHRKRVLASRPQTVRSFTIQYTFWGYDVVVASLAFTQMVSVRFRVPLQNKDCFAPVEAPWWQPLDC